MAVAIKLRGPDGQGIITKDIVALGQRRLSIIDLGEGGRQPMANGMEGGGGRHLQPEIQRALDQSLPGGHGTTGTRLVGIAGVL